MMLSTTILHGRPALPSIGFSVLFGLEATFAGWLVQRTTGGIVVAVSIFGDGLDPLARVPAYVLPFLLWPVFRFGPGSASAALFIASLIGLSNAAQG